MRILPLLLATVVTGWAEEENSAQRLENAQKGIAEASWPKKPDHRLSSFSGKMKQLAEISPKYCEVDKQYRLKSAENWNKEANADTHTTWTGSDKPSWSEKRWNREAESIADKRGNDRFQPSGDFTPVQTLGPREWNRENIRDWSTRPSLLGNQADGSLRMYEGRLIRVRESVLREDPNPRELGSGRQETFRPEDVEAILSRPMERPWDKIKE